MPEIWKPVAGYEGLYEVSSCGNVRSLFRYRKVLKPSRHLNGYLSVELFKDKTSKRMLVHRLVANAFIPNESELPFVNHKDEAKDNNAVDNLEWCNAKYNSNYGTLQKRRIDNTDYTKEIYKEIARRNGTKQSKPVVQFGKDGTLIKRFASGKEAARQTGFDHSHILECCAGKRYKTVGGYVWRFDERSVALSDSQF